MDTKPKRMGRPPTWPLRSQVETLLDKLSDRSLNLGKALDRAGITRRQLERLRADDPWFDYQLRRLMRRFHGLRLMGGDIHMLEVLELEADLLPSEWMDSWAEVKRVIERKREVASAIPEARAEPVYIPPNPENSEVQF